MIYKYKALSDINIYIRIVLVKSLLVLFIGCSEQSATSEDEVSNSNSNGSTTIVDDTTSLGYTFSKFDRYGCSTQMITTKQKISMNLSITVYTSRKTGMSRICQKTNSTSNCYDGYSSSSGEDGVGNYTLYALSSSNRKEKIYLYQYGNISRLELISSSLCYKYYK